MSHEKEISKAGRMYNNTQILKLRIAPLQSALALVIPLSLTL